MNELHNDSHRTRVVIHPLWSLLLLLAVLTQHTAPLLSFYVWVALHEGGHWWAALRCGWSIRSICVAPYGIMLEVEATDRRVVRTEMVVVCAGLAVTMVIVLLLSWCKTNHWLPESMVLSALEQNIHILFGNLLPIWPLDGGRLLRLVLCRWLPYVSAIRWSVAISVAIALFVFLYAVWQLKQGQWSIHTACIMCYLVVLNATEWRYASVRVLRQLLGEKPPEDQREASHMLTRIQRWRTWKPQ